MILLKKSFIYANKSISREEIRNIVVEFFEYMKEHLKDEQGYMDLIGYPYLKEHTMMHKDIIAGMASLIKTSKNVSDLKENLSLIAGKWLVEHILKEDAKDRKVASISVAIRIIRSRREKAIPMHLQLSA